MYSEVDEEREFFEPTFSLAKRSKTVLLGLILIGAVVVGSATAAHQSKKSQRNDPTIRLEDGGGQWKNGNAETDVEKAIASRIVHNDVKMQAGMFAGKDIPSGPDDVIRPPVTSAGWSGYTVRARGGPQSFSLDNGDQRVEEICIYYGEYVRGIELTYGAFGASPTTKKAGNTKRDGTIAYACGSVGGSLCFGNVNVKVSPHDRRRPVASSDYQGVSSMAFYLKQVGSGSLGQEEHVFGGQHRGGDITGIRSGNFCLGGIRGKLTAGALTEVELKYVG